MNKLTPADIWRKIERLESQLSRGEITYNNFVGNKNQLYNQYVGLEQNRTTGDK